MEKSPPNLVRYRRILEIFSGARVVVNARNPYANIASISGRNWPDDLDADARATRMTEAAERWLGWAKGLRAAHEEDGYPLLTYEAFCAEPKRLAEALSFDPDAFDAAATVKVKDYEPQPIVNMNERQLATLTERDRGAITDVLSGEPDLLAFFGYQIMRHHA